MNKLLTLAFVALLAGAACVVDGASAAANQTILPGGCVKLPGTPVAHGKRSDPARFVIRAEVKWFGNSYFRGPNGLIGGTLKLCPWESCYIVVDGKTILVQGLPGDIVDQQGYNGQTLVLVGRLVQQKGGPMVPPDVLIVERFYSVTK